MFTTPELKMDLIISVILSLNVVVAPSPQQVVDTLPLLTCNGIEVVLLRAVKLDPGPACVIGTAESYRVF